MLRTLPANKAFSDPTAIGLPSAWTALRPHRKQIEALTTPIRFVGLDCGRGSGKTSAVVLRKLVLSLPVKKPWPDPRYFYCADTLSHAKQIAWEALLALIPSHWVEGTRETLSMMEIRTIFGSSLYLYGLKNPRAMEGRQYDGGAVDESCDCTPGVFSKTIVPLLFHRDGWCIRSGVPKRQGIGSREFKKFCEGARPSNPNRDKDEISFTWPSSDIVPPEQLDYQKRRLSLADYNEQFNAAWQTAGGGIFYSFSRDYNVRQVNYRTDLPLVIGCDFNLSPMAWVIGHIHFDGKDPTRLEIFDRLFIHNCYTTYALDCLWERYSSHRSGFWFHCDASSTGRTTATALTDYALILNDHRFSGSPGGRRICFPRRSTKDPSKTEANPKLKDRFAATNALLRNASGQTRCIIDDYCEELIDDLENRHAAEGTWEPEDGEDEGHISDALGYIIWRWWPISLQSDVKLAPPAVIIGGNRYRT